MIQDQKRIIYKAGGRNYCPVRRSQTGWYRVGENSQHLPMICPCPMLETSFSDSALRSRNVCWGAFPTCIDTLKVAAQKRKGKLRGSKHWWKLTCGHLKTEPLVIKALFLSGKWEWLTAWTCEGNMCKQGKYIKHWARGSFKKVLIGKKSGFFSVSFLNSCNTDAQGCWPTSPTIPKASITNPKNRLFLQEGPFKSLLWAAVGWGRRWWQREIRPCQKQHTSVHETWRKQSNLPLLSGTSILVKTPFCWKFSGLRSSDPHSTEHTHTHTHTHTHKHREEINI